MEVLKFVSEAQFSPLGFSELVKGQHINALDVSERVRKPREPVYVFGQIRPSGNEHITEPDRTPGFSQPARETQRGLKFLARQAQIGLLVPALDVEKHQVDVAHHFFINAIAEKARGIDGRVQAMLLYPPQKRL